MGKHSAPGGCMAIRELTKAGLFTFGTDGTRGIGKLGLITAIRAYRLIPVSIRHRLHPQPGSSAQGLAAARSGAGRAGVAAAIAACGCA